jgi:aminopeptidase N
MLLTEEKQTFVFEEVAFRPVLSALRGLSAPVRRGGAVPAEDRLVLARNDADLVSRWQSLNALELAHLVKQSRAVQNGDPVQGDPVLAHLKSAIAFDDELDPAYRAFCLAVPDETEIIRELGENVDVAASHAARRAWLAEVARAASGGGLWHRATGPVEAFEPTALQAGQRALANAAVELACVALGDNARAVAAFASASNMTDRLAALAILNNHFPEAAETAEALASFRAKHDGEPLILDKWRTLIAVSPGEAALAKVQAAWADPSHDPSNPNRVRSLIGAFAMSNPTGFHRVDGLSYEWFADRLIEFDALNPQVAARMLTALRSWRALEPVRREKLRSQIARIAATARLSRDSADIAARMLG